MPEGITVTINGVSYVVDKDNEAMLVSLIKAIGGDEVIVIEEEKAEESTEEKTEDNG